MFYWWYVNTLVIILVLCEYKRWEVSQSPNENMVVECESVWCQSYYRCEGLRPRSAEGRKLSLSQNSQTKKEICILYPFLSIQTPGNWRGPIHIEWRGQVWPVLFIFSLITDFFHRHCRSEVTLTQVSGHPIARPNWHNINHHRRICFPFLF